MIKNRVKFFTILFLAVSILDIIGVILNLEWIRFIFKPLIIPSLMGLYYYSVDKMNKWYLVALIFSFLGDVLLLDKFNYFLFGIGSFLITQILFIKIIMGQLNKSSLGWKTMAVLPFLAFYVILMYKLKDGVEEFLFPVALYGITISIFGVVSLLNYLGSKNSRSSKYLLFGATIFIVSDTMIALNKFHEPHIIYPATIMITYVLAQYLIFKYMVRLKITSAK